MPVLDCHHSHYKCFNRSLIYKRSGQDFLPLIVQRCTAKANRQAYTGPLIVMNVFHVLSQIRPMLEPVSALVAHVRSAYERAIRAPHSNPDILAQIAYLNDIYELSISQSFALIPLRYLMNPFPTNLCQIRFHPTTKIRWFYRYDL